MAYDPPLSPIPMELPDLSTNPQWDATKAKEFFAQINAWAATQAAAQAAWEIDWTTFVPSFTGLVVGSAPVTARWRKEGNKAVVDITVKMVGATTSAVDWRFDLPAGAPLAAAIAPDAAVNPVIGQVTFRDDSAGPAWYVGAVLGIKSGNRAIILAPQAGSNLAPVGGSVPFAWNTGDSMHLHLEYATA